MRKFLAIILAVSMLMCLLAGCGNEPAEDENNDILSDGGDVTATSDVDYILEKGEVVVGVCKLYAPMNYRNDANDLVGFETEFAQAVFERIGVTPRFEIVDATICTNELNSKKIDCVWNGLVITSNAKSAMEISNPYMANKQVMVVKKENAERYADGVLGTAVVAEKDSAGEKVATTDDFFKDAAFTSVESMEVALRAVKSGSAGVAIVDNVVALSLIGEGTDFADLVVVSDREYAQEEYGVAFRKGSDMATVVNNTIEELIADGTLDAIAAKYKLENLIIKE